MNNLKKLSISGRESIEEQKKTTREIYISRKPEVKMSNSLDKVIKEDLGIKGVKTNAYIRYLVDGLTDEEYQTALPTIFGELPVEDLIDSQGFESNIGNQKVLNIESLPGQFDDVVDATKQCLMLQTGNQNHNVRAFSTIIFHGEISDEEMARIQKYLINPVDKHHVDLDDKNLLRNLPSPENVKILDGFTDLDDEGLNKFIKQYGLAMNLDDIKFAQEYFTKKCRNPKLTEIKVLDTYRSDHCRHTTFNTQIQNVKFQENKDLSNDVSCRDMRYIYHPYFSWGMKNLYEK